MTLTPQARTPNETRLLKKWSYGGIRFLLGSIFLFSGASKLVAPDSFMLVMNAYGLIPEITLMPAAILLASLETIAGIGLMMDIRGSLSLISGMLCFFLLVVGYGIHLGLDIDCGCFGPNDPEGIAFHGLRSAAYRDIGMMSAACILFYQRKRFAFTPVGIYHYVKKIRGESR